MLKQLLDRFGTTLYIQLWEARIRVVDFSTGAFYDDEPLLVKNGKTNAIGIGRTALSGAGADAVVINPFSHPRVLFADFPSGQLMLAEAIKKVVPKRLLTPSPFVIIHPMEKTEGGLTIIEDRAFRELGLGVGARDVLIYEGETLTPGGFDFQALKARRTREREK